VSEHVRAAIQQVTGARVKFMIRVEPGRGDAGSGTPERSSTATAPAADPPADPDPVPAAITATTEWAVAVIPGADEQTAAPDAPASAPSPEVAPVAAEVEAAPEPAPKAPAPHASDGTGRQRYGEAVVREMLGATFLLEETLEPAVSLQPASAMTDPAAQADPNRPSSADAPDPFRDEF
jgi:DNA polymerase-3 subunit gamma/tau